MHHDCGGDVIEDPRIDQQGFASTELLSRRADQRDRETKFFGNFCQAQSGTDRGSRNDVVAARMSQSGQRVVLGTDCDNKWSGAKVRPKRGSQSSCASCDLEATLGDKSLGFRAASMFLESQFRFAMD
jgi:hypothetical protein